MMDCIKRHKAESGGPAATAAASWPRVCCPIEAAAGRLPARELFPDGMVGMAGALIESSIEQQFCSRPSAVVIVRASGDPGAAAINNPNAAHTADGSADLAIVFRPAIMISARCELISHGQSWAVRNGTRQL